MTSLRSMITSSKKRPMVTIARSAHGCRQPSWHRWHGLPTMGWLRTGGGGERETQVAESSKLGACRLGGQCGLGGSIHSVYHSLPFPFLWPDLHPGS